jgi:hypothetical protein
LLETTKDAYIAMAAVEVLGRMDGPNGKRFLQ